MYKLTKTTLIFRTADGVYIPPAQDNYDYMQYLAWTAAGNTPDPYVAPTLPAPVVVDMAQARLALLQAGHLATVNAAIASLPGIEGDAARIEWEFRTTVRRDSALTQAMATILSLDEIDLDELFTLAATL